MKPETHSSEGRGKQRKHRKRKQLSDKDEIDPRIKRSKQLQDTVHAHVHEHTEGGSSTSATSLMGGTASDKGPLGKGSSIGVGLPYEGTLPSIEEGPSSVVMGGGGELNIGSLDEGRTSGTESGTEIEGSSSVADGTTIQPSVAALPTVISTGTVMDGISVSEAGTDTGTRNEIGNENGTGNKTESQPSGSTPADVNAAGLEEGQISQEGPSMDDNERMSIEELLASFRRKMKKRKRKRRRRREAELEGHRVKGLERMDTFDPGSEDEEDKTMDKQNNLILRKLFKKSGE